MGLPMGERVSSAKLFTPKQMETPTGLPHDTRMPVNQSSGCGVVYATHTYWWLWGRRELAYETCAPTRQARGGRFRMNDFTRLNGYLMTN